MLDWIGQNKQWVFSGAGITVLAAVWWFLQKLLRTKSYPAPASINNNSVTQAPVISVAPVINVIPHQAEQPHRQARELIEAIADVRIFAQEAKTAAEVLDAKANSLRGGHGEYARVLRVAPTEHGNCINALIRLQSAVSTAKQCLVQARNAGLFGEIKEVEEGILELPSPYSNLSMYLHAVEAASACEEPTSWFAGERMGKREVRWEQIVESLKVAEQQNPQVNLNAMTSRQDSKGSLVPNLVLKNIHMGGLIFTGDEWRQFELPEGPLSNRLQAVWAELKNDSSELRRVGPISGVKAELVVIRESGDEKFSPLVWLDNEFNAVNFELADTRHVLLVANMDSLLSPTSAWVVPLNHRSDSALGSSLRMDVSHWMEKENAELRLNLLHITTGAVLQSFAGKYVWREGRSGPSITLKPL